VFKQRYRKAVQELRPCGQNLGGIFVRDNLKASLLVVLGLLAVSVPLFAHHGNASYDNKDVTIKGTVTAWLWTNPHSFLKLDVKDDKGNIVHWVCENQAPSTLVNFGFTAKTFKPGDEVTVVLSATSKSLPVGRIRKIILADGYVMNSEVR
jgi:Family of unknown function (DUF6152)